MRLISNWREAWKWHSVHGLVLLTAIPTIWHELPYEIKDMIPDNWVGYISIAVGLITLLGRLRDQGSN